MRQLHDYDTAFGKFFTRLATDGITTANTLFVFTVDEGDHFAGRPPKALRRRHDALHLHARQLGARPAAAGEPDRRGERDDRLRCSRPASRRSTSTSTRRRTST